MKKFIKLLGVDNIYRYLDDDEGIKKYFSAFHLHDTFPAAVVIDDFGNYFQERYFLSLLS